MLIDRDRKRSTLHPHDEMLRERPRALAGAHRRRARSRPTTARCETGGPLEGAEVPGYSDAGPEEPVKVADRVLAGFGWQRDDVKLVQQMASNGAEPIGSLGYDGPLAALSPERQNLADYFKETVAVVTNPAIDREREIEHFSTRAVFGRRPSLDDRRDGHRHGRDRLPGDPRRPPRPGAALRQAPTAGSPASTGTYLLEDLWEEFRGRADGDRHLAARVGDDPGRDRAAQAGGGEEGPRRRRAARPHRPHRLRRRAPLPRPAPGDLGGRPGAEAVPGRARRGEPAPPLRHRAALGGDPQRPRRDARPRPRRQRRLPLRDGRGDLRRRLRERRRQPLRGAAQGDREGDLDDRDPRGARLRAPVLLDRGQARAGRDLPDRGLRRLREGRRRLRRARRRHRRARSGSSPATRRRSRRRRSASTRRSTRRRSPTANGTGDLRRVLGEGPRPRGAEPDLDAPHHGPEGRPRPGRPGRRSTPASATTTTRS